MNETPFPQAFLHKFLKLFFDLLYHQFAWAYDFVAWAVSLGMWQDWIRAAIPFLDGESILEIGHGPGHLLASLPPTDSSPVGIDLSPQMGTIAKQRLTRQGSPARLANASGKQLPFRSGFFDHVAATFPTEYITHPETLHEIHRVLKPGGTFILLPVAWITGESPLPRLAKWLFEVTGQTLDRDHPQFEVGMKLLRDHNFSPETKHILLKNSEVLVIQAAKK